MKPDKTMKTELKLNRLLINNFKGIKSFEMTPDGDNVSISAENGVGKTTVYDTFLWLFFGKNSEAKKDFPLVPLDKNNQPIKGLVVSVEADIDCGGTLHCFKKEQHEKVTKNLFKGYETFCWIDDVPKKVSEYSKYIAKLIPEDIFRLLTDLNYFNGTLHWEERRKFLLDIADEIGTPEGFDELTAALNGRTHKEYKKVLAERKTRYEKDRAECNPRIDEIQRGLDEYAGTDAKDVAGQRSKLEREIAVLDGKRAHFFGTETQRQGKIDLVNELVKKRNQRAAELANDTTGIQSLLTEKHNIEVSLAAVRQVALHAKNDWTTNQTNLSAAGRELEPLTVSLDRVCDEWDAYRQAPVDDTCFNCGQSMPADKMAKSDRKRQNALDAITDRGNEIKAEVDACKKTIAEYGSKTKQLEKAMTAAAAQLQKAEQEKSKRCAVIDKRIAANETLPPESDKTWKIFDSQIKATEAEIGEPAAKQIENLDAEITAKKERLSAMNDSLRKADRMKQDQTRIAELEEDEKTLAQNIADVDKQLAEIASYKETESRMIEQAVNCKFKYVTFKLFNRLINGETEPCCEALLNGKPYHGGMSDGERIFVGVDIINVLGAYYDKSVTLFIDHAESLTLPIETDNQVIRLCVKPKTKKLVVKKELGELAHV